MARWLLNPERDRSTRRMVTMPITRLLPMLTILSLALGCGSGSGLDPDLEPTDLRTDDAEELCNWVQSRVDKVFTPKKQQELSCTVEGVVAASSVDRPELCEDAYKLCMDDSTPANYFDPLPCHRVRADDIDRDCRATVGEFEACILAIEAELKNVMEDFTCDHIGSSRSRMNNLRDRIEDLFEDDDDERHPLEDCRKVARNCEDFVFWD